MQQKIYCVTPIYGKFDLRFSYYKYKET